MSKSGVINVKINDQEEIEYVTYDDENQEYSDAETITEIELEEEVDESDEAEPYIIAKPDGSMSIKLEKGHEIEHICGKCNKSFQSLEELGPHLKKCRLLKSEAKPAKILNSFVSPAVKPAKRPTRTRILNKLASENKIDEIEEPPILVSSESACNKPKRKLLCYCCDENKVDAHKGKLMCTSPGCNVGFSSNMARDKHLFSVHCPDTQYKCSLCIASCPSQGVLDLHMETHKPEKPFQCRNCGRSFTRKYHLERHLLHTSCDDTVPKQELPCSVCGKVFTRIDNLRDHLRSHLGNDRKKRDYQCPHCEKSFYGSSLLNIHIRTHTGEKPFPCDLCDKSFSSTGALRKHRRTHTGEKPYVCSICDSAFSAKETLNRHFKLHTGERPHKCQYCDKAFIQVTQLQAHLFHHTGENSFECSICNRKFNRKSRLQTHIKFVHEGIKPFQCEICSKSFTVRSEYNRHMNVHRGIKEFKCNVCDREFTAKASLQAHLQTHCKEEPSTCKICNKRYIRADCLVRHVRKVHRDALFDIISDAEQKKLKITPGGRAVLPKTNVQENSNENSDNDINEDNQDDLIDDTLSQTSYEISEEFDNSKVKLEKIDEMNENEIMESLENSIFLNEVQLKKSIGALLNLLIDEETLASFGWPNTSVEEVLSSVISRCGHKPANYNDCSDYTTKMRENTKLLFTVVIDDDSIKTLLNNHTIDEVIIRVLKMSKGEA